MKPFALLAPLLLLLSLGAPAQDRMNLNLSQEPWNISLDPCDKWNKTVLYLSSNDAISSSVVLSEQVWDSLFSHPDVTGIAIPATVEQYLWGRNGQTFGVSGNYTGVSWFTTKIFIPREWEGKRIAMLVGSVRFRAEIFVNRILAGYDVVNSTPFVVDLTDRLLTGAENEIAFRITDPNGNFNWKDSQVYTWGDYDVNPSHGFGGITGPVTLEATDKQYISNIFIKNKPDPREIDVDITIDNQLEDKDNQPLHIEIAEARSGRVVYAKTSILAHIPKGENVFSYNIKVKEAKLWSVDEPNLYQMKVAVGNDQIMQRFGFRWFEVRTIDGDRQFYLNDKRIVLRSAISWGFWPDNGIFPTDEYARKQVLSAKQLGLNMLSFHRAIGQTNVMDAADELGLLIWEEPGGNQYSANRMANPDERAKFYLDYRIEKLSRMIRRDRNHPSLIIYNLHNERGAEPQPADYQEMEIAHKLDPSRQINYNSSNGPNPEGVPSARFKLHLRPYDTTFYDNGWYDQHHAGGPGVYHDNLYRSPTDYLRYTANKQEIIYWGEEGAIGTPPRLELIRNDILSKKAFGGWEAADYLEWYEAYDQFIKKQGFSEAFPSVDALTVAMGNVAYYYQGRVIENIRINNTIDGYAVNGWEAMKLENHSGIVDNYRNPKGDPELISRYNQPLLLSVKLNKKVMAVGDSTRVDVFIINEKDLKGNFILRVALKDANEKVMYSTSKKVYVKGGFVYGENLFSGNIGPIVSAGYASVEATLFKGKELILRGDDSAFMVRMDKISPTSGGFLGDTINDLNDNGILRGEFSVFMSLTNNQAEAPEGFFDKGVAVDRNVLSHREEGVFTPKYTLFDFLPRGGLVADSTGLLQAYMRQMGVSVESYTNGIPKGSYLLVGAFEPQQWGSNMSDVVDWVQKGGSVVIVDNPVRWAEYLADKEVLDYRGAKELGRSWYGGNFFNRAHPVVFEGLPTGVAFNWEYQCFAAYNRRRIGLRVGSGETLVGCVSDHRHEVYSALSVIPVGRGKIILTTLDIPACIRSAVEAPAAVDVDGMNEALTTFNASAENPANVVGQKLLFNLIREAVAR